jgi:predicted DNA-binding transcriptional regulator YafY
MSTSARMLSLLSLLQNHRYWPGSELSERLAVSPRTLRRDVDRLRELGYPVVAGRGVGGGYQLRAGASLPPLLLDDEEAVAVAVGLRSAAGGSVAGIEETSLRALTKLTAVMPPRLRRRVDALQDFTVPSVTAGPTVDAETLSLLAQACRDDERVEFTYTPDGREPSQRLVEPHRLVSHGRRWYLVAWDVNRGDWRTFRIDRLGDPRVTGARFRQRELPGGNAADFVRAGFTAVPRHDVLVEIRAPADQVRAVAKQWGTVEAVGHDTCRLQLQADSFDWAVLLLSAIGVPFQVLRPPELAAHLRATGRLFQAAGG